MKATAAPAPGQGVGEDARRAADAPTRRSYYAKEHGRNQVHSHADLVARGELQVDEKASDIELF